MSARIERVTFPGGAGDALAARLDLPAGPARAHALFAHCFTCGHDIASASRIASSLTEAGFAVLRFDFTGLGLSEGEFANTDFSSNTADLVAAADWLGRERQAPQLLVGHSLGGAAVLSVASRIPAVRAVAVIGTPSSPEHVERLLAGSVEDIERHGEAVVEVGERPFRIRRSFLADLGEHRVLDEVGTFGKALLVLHSPVDNVVGVENAAEIYTSARHPKSFVSLDGADHLLTDHSDADYAASMIGAFAARYTTDESDAAPAPGPSADVVVAETTQGPFLNHVVIGPHAMLADEPESSGGFDAGPSPYDFLGAALGSCTSMTLRMYADRKGLALDRVSVEVHHEKVHASDVLEDIADRPLLDGRGRIDRFQRTITLLGPSLTDAERQRLLEIADRCPVHRTLERTSVIVTSLSEPSTG